MFPSKSKNITPLYHHPRRTQIYTIFIWFCICCAQPHTKVHKKVHKKSLWYCNAGWIKPDVSCFLLQTQLIIVRIMLFTFKNCWIFYFHRLTNNLDLVMLIGNKIDWNKLHQSYLTWDPWTVCDPLSSILRLTSRFQ